MRSIMFLSLSAALLTGACGCRGQSTKSGAGNPSGKPQVQALPSGVFAPEEIYRTDGTLKYRVFRLTMSGQVVVHEVEFYNEKGDTLIKKHNYLLGALKPKVVIAWYYTNGKLAETRHYRLTDGTVQKVEFHDRDGKVIKVEERESDRKSAEALPEGIF